MKLNETSLPQNFSKALFEEKNYDLAPEHMDKITCTLFEGTSNLLKAAERQDKPTAVTFERMDGSVIAAALAIFIPNEDESKPGNWTLSWTFYEDDIPEDAVRISIKDTQTHPYYRAIAGDRWGMRFKDPGALVNLLTFALEQIEKWLDENAKESEEVSVEDDNFRARVKVENGEKVFALEALGEVKAGIKNDTDIEK